MQWKTDGEYPLPVPCLNCTIISFDLSSSQAPKIMQGDGDPSPSCLVVGAAIRGHDAIVILPETAEARGWGDGQFISIESSRPIINCKIARTSVKIPLKDPCQIHTWRISCKVLLQHTVQAQEVPRHFPLPVWQPIAVCLNRSAHVGMPVQLILRPSWRQYRTVLSKYRARPDR